MLAVISVGGKGRPGLKVQVDLGAGRILPRRISRLNSFEPAAPLDRHCDSVLVIPAAVSVEQGIHLLRLEEPAEPDHVARFEFGVSLGRVENVGGGGGDVDVLDRVQMLAPTQSGSVVPFELEAKRTVSRQRVKVEKGVSDASLALSDPAFPMQPRNIVLLPHIRQLLVKNQSTYQNFFIIFLKHFLKSLNHK